MAGIVGLQVSIDGPLFEENAPFEAAAHRSVNELIELGVRLTRAELRKSTPSRRFVRRIRAYRTSGSPVSGYVDAPGTGVMPRWLEGGERSVNRGHFTGHRFFHRASRELDRRKGRIVALRIAQTVAYLNGWAKPS